MEPVVNSKGKHMIIVHGCDRSGLTKSIGTDKTANIKCNSLKNVDDTGLVLPMTRVLPKRERNPFFAVVYPQKGCQMNTTIASRISFSTFFDTGSDTDNDGGFREVVKH